MLEGPGRVNRRAQAGAFAFSVRARRFKRNELCSRYLRAQSVSVLIRSVQFALTTVSSILNGVRACTACGIPAGMRMALPAGTVCAAPPIVICASPSKT